MHFYIALVIESVDTKVQKNGEKLVTQFQGKNYLRDYTKSNC